MSLAIFGLVRSWPVENSRPDTAQRRAAERNEMWARRFESLGILLESQRKEAATA